MHTYVYRSAIKPDLYVYLASVDGLEQLPDPVRKQLGDAELAMSIELTEDTKLARENTGKVLRNLQTQGFHIQMPHDVDAILAVVARSVAP